MATTSWWRSATSGDVGSVAPQGSRSSHPSARARWKDLAEGDELACRPVFAIELLHNSINPEDHQRLRNGLEAAFDWVWPNDDTARLALRLQQRELPISGRPGIE
jgi:predicted nucleic acid-binding protein